MPGATTSVGAIRFRGLFSDPKARRRIRRRVQHGCSVLVQSRCSRFSWCWNVGLQPSLPCLASSGVSASPSWRRSWRSREVDTVEAVENNNVLQKPKGFNRTQTSDRDLFQLDFRLLLLKGRMLSGRRGCSGALTCCLGALAFGNSAFVACFRSSRGACANTAVHDELTGTRTS